MSAPVARPPQARWRWLWLLGWLLLLARLAYVVGHQPLAGFGNQFDMLRTTSCVGLRPEAQLAPGQASPAAPVVQYLRDGPFDANCLPGTEVALVQMALVIDGRLDALAGGDPQRFPLRLLAVFKAILLLAMLALLDWRLRAWPGVRAAHPLLAALVLADPFNTLYLAGFYTEFAALLAAWAALAWPLPWLLGGRAPGMVEVATWGIFLAALLLARFQHAATPLVLLAWLAWLGWRMRWPLARLLVPLLLLVPALVATLHWQADYRTIADANRWNSFFGAALPAAQDLAQVVARLQLPAACAELAHTTWYLRRGRDARAECPAGLQMPRARWLAVLSADPTALARWIGRGVTLSGQWRPGYLGELAGERFGRLPAGPLGLGSSFADGIARLPWLGLLPFWSVPLLLLTLWPPGLSRVPPGSGGAAEPVDALRDWLMPQLAALLVLGWAASLVGDGYSELARHLHLAGNAALLAALLSPLVLRAAWRERKRGWLGAMHAAFWLLATLGLAAWWYGQGIAYGVLDTPADDRAGALSGWAMDPRGVAAVELAHADGRRQRLTLTPAAEQLGAYFGTGVGRHAVRFAGSAATSGPYDIVVIAASGEPTVIDRRFPAAE